ncbi:zinc ribbon domain-containing protein [Candidatus Bathyarchaeota archaeon]|nr:zinc ribbon domain-containing protein [Candidatus Bathyarchaeota archaeon]
MPYCPHCGKEVSEGTKYCESCGEAIIGNLEQSQEKGLIEHLQTGVNFTFSHPVVFIPEALAGLWGIAIVRGFGVLADLFDLQSWYDQIYPQMVSVAYTVNDYPELPPGIWSFMLAALLLVIVWVSVSGMFTFASVHMIWSGYKNEKMGAVGSFRYVLGRFGKLFLAAFIGNLLALTFILIPAVIFMYAVMVVDGTGIRDGLSKGFSLSLKRIIPSIVLIVLYYVAKIACGYIPYVGDVVVAIPVTIVTVVFVDLYISSK